jgi:membrane-bound serine protease (ClpP class)
VFALGLLLVLTGAALAAAEAHVPSHGALGAGAVISLATGVALLAGAAGSTAFAAVLAGLIVAAAGGGALYAMVLKALSVRRLGAASNSLIGRVGVARASDRVFVDGELWRARTWGIDEDERPIATGDHVVVENVKGLTLTVRPAEEWELL